MQDSEIRKLCEEVEEYSSKATPGPWVRIGEGVDFPGFGISSQIGDGTSFRVANTDIDDHEIEQQRHDAEFIVRSRTDLPKLVAALREKLEAERWIAVDEELPKLSGEYMVWPGAFIDNHSAQFHNVTKQWTQSGINGVVTHYVTHWKPISAPEVQA